jgi:hypothetical protein
MYRSRRASNRLVVPLKKPTLTIAWAKRPGTMNLP